MDETVPAREYRNWKKAVQRTLYWTGGILGTAVTWRAARAGLRVAMVDAGDFAGATSSASTKLVHGGLRYLLSPAQWNTLRAQQAIG